LPREPSPDRALLARGRNLPPDARVELGELVRVDLGAPEAGVDLVATHNSLHGKWSRDIGHGFRRPGRPKSSINVRENNDSSPEYSLLAEKN
jgi:hypothetical protein